MVEYEKLMNICIRRTEIIKLQSELLRDMECELGLYCLIDAEEKKINNLERLSKELN